MLRNSGNLLWTAKHSKIALKYVLFLITGFLLVYNTRAVHPVWFLVIMAITGWYFLTLSYCGKKWLPLTEKQFEKKLFWHSLLYRVGASILLIVVAQITWGQPDYVGAIDARSYHREGLIVADFLRNLDISQAYFTAIAFTGSVDNSGPPMLLGVIFALFGNHYFIASFVFCLLGALAVLFIYRTAAIIWGNDIGRTTGILFMHFPLSLFFSAVFLKEGIVVFLMAYVVYITTKAINGKSITWLNFIFLIAAMASLFFFRTAVGALCAILVPAALLINRYKGSRIKSVTIAVFAAGLFGFAIYTMGEYEFFLNRIKHSGDHWAEGRTERLVEGGGLSDLTVLDVAASPIYLAMSVIAPFPGMVDVPTRFDTSHDQNWYFMPGEIIWNILAFFSIIGFYYSVRSRMFQSFMVWAFTAGYLYVLIATVLFTRVRFAYIGMPLMLALAAVGLSRSQKKSYWIIYLIAVGIMTLIWNYLRLNIRELV